MNIYIPPPQYRPRLFPRWVRYALYAIAALGFVGWVVGMMWMGAALFGGHP